MLKFKSPVFSNHLPTYLVADISRWPFAVFELLRYRAPSDLLRSAPQPTTGVYRSVTRLAKTRQASRLRSIPTRLQASADALCRAGSLTRGSGSGDRHASTPFRHRAKTAHWGWLTGFASAVEAQPLRLQGFALLHLQPSAGSGLPNCFKASLRYAFKPPPPLLTLALSLEPHPCPQLSLSDNGAVIGPCPCLTPSLRPSG